MKSFRAIWLAICLLSGVAHGADWPQWRGPLRNGTSPETGWNTDWKTKPPELLWEKPVGDGMSHPAVVDGKVYVFGLIDGAKDEILCLDLEKGETLWRTTAGAVTRGRHRNRIRGPVATPAVHEGLLFTYHRTHDLRCWSTDGGKLLWEVNLLARYGLRSSKTRAYWTPGNSPLALGDKVIVSGHGRTGAVALNTRSGELVWKAVGADDSNYDGPRPGEGGSNVWASPTPVMINKRWHVLLNLNKDVVCIDAATGKETWRSQEEHWPSPAAVSDPVLADDTIVVPGYRRGEGVGRVFDLKGKLLRRLPKLLVQTSTPVYRSGWLFTPGRTINVKTGEHARMVRGVPIIVDGKIIALGSKKLSLMRFRDGKFESLGSVNVSGDQYAAPIFSGGRILFRSTRTRLACWDVRSKRQGQLPTTSFVPGSGKLRSPSGR